MIRSSIVATALICAIVPFGGAPRRGEATTTRLGWISDKGCATARLDDDTLTPNGTDCVKKCLDGGATAVFVDPKAHVLYEVNNLESVKAEVGYYLEVTGEVDEKAKTITVGSVRRLGDVIQMCGRKPKK